ncbi:hypothetical protein KOR42_10030 [Thalassoglobus neptunius]|uniref:Uncharacterized protein n=1 Tax=Thalassoglobus neptunius TaxID=1938619 RepID=A0A5C5X5N8_9PLAN|nr:hypothetical protein KOR42_10030 [Thalassoglobus neptunius]
MLRRMSCPLGRIVLRAEFDLREEVVGAFRFRIGQLIEQLLCVERLSVAFAGGDGSDQCCGEDESFHSLFPC